MLVGACNLMLWRIRVVRYMIADGAAMADQYGHKKELCVLGLGLIFDHFQHGCSSPCRPTFAGMPCHDMPFFHSHGCRTLIGDSDRAVTVTVL